MIHKIVAMGQDGSADPYRFLGRGWGEREYWRVRMESALLCAGIGYLSYGNVIQFLLTNVINWGRNILVSQTGPHGFRFREWNLESVRFRRSLTSGDLSNLYIPFQLFSKSSAAYLAAMWNYTNDAEAAITFTFTTGMDALYLIPQRIYRGYSTKLAILQWLGIPACNFIMTIPILLGFDMDHGWWVVSRRVIGGIWLGVFEYLEDRNRIRQSGAALDT